MHFSLNPVNSTINERLASQKALLTRSTKQMMLRSRATTEELRRNHASERLVSTMI